MIEIANNIFVGAEQDFYTIQNQENWAILHCCKNPFHCDFVGYKGTISSTHPDYALKRKGNEMALNLVDMNTFSENYLSFNENMFRVAFEFLDKYREQGCKILIHCNQGESRGPTMGMFYSAYCGLFGSPDFDETVAEFRKLYLRYNPKRNIFCTAQALWNKFVK